MAQSNFTPINDLVFPFKNYVLALPGWYPTWLDAMPGDFNQRQILAAAQHVPQIVLYVAKDQSGTLTKTTVRYNQLSKFAIEICVLYPTTKFIDGVRSNLYFINLLSYYAALIKKRWGKPKLLHSYIVVRGGLAGYYLAKRWKLPFVLTEHWTIYYPGDPGYLGKRGRLFKWSVKKVFKAVDMFLPVTGDLNDKIKAFVKQVSFQVIPNVVDTDLFLPPKTQTQGGEFKFIHVSTMGYQKNPQGLLRGFKAVHNAYPQATLLMVGPYAEEVKAYAGQLGLAEKTVRFTGAVEYKKVAELLQTCNALVLFSRYENLPCVILEALCTGLPVISANVGGIAEVVNTDNGILIEPGNETELYKALEDMLLNHNRFTVDQISNHARLKFSYATVGKQISDVYEKFFVVE